MGGDISLQARRAYDLLRGGWVGVAEWIRDEKGFRVLPCAGISRDIVDGSGSEIIRDQDKQIVDLPLGGGRIFKLNFDPGACISGNIIFQPGGTVYFRLEAKKPYKMPRFKFPGLS